MYQHFHGVQVTYPPSACLPWAAMRTMNPYIFVAATQTLLIGRGAHAYLTAIFAVNMAGVCHILPVFALYQRNTRVLIALLTLFISGLICTATTFSIHLLKPMNYNTTCDPLKVANRWVYFLTSYILPHPLY
jgi:fluoride ion exporter CrcB/FEX